MTQPRFWAKTGAGNLRDNGQPEYHPVICHLADTAAVAMELVRSHLSPVAINRLSEGFGLSGTSLVRFCGFMAGSHDLGKVSPAFQFQVSEVGKRLAGNTLYDCWSSFPPERRSQTTPHGWVTAATLPEFLVNIGVGRTLSKRHAKRLAQKLGVIVGGHHGFFPCQQDIDNLDYAIAGTDARSVWRQHSLSIFQQLQDVVQLTDEDVPNQCDNAAAMILAGLTTVSDWIASNPDEASGFPYANDTPFETYATTLEEKAKTALAKQGWQPPPAGSPLAFKDLFPFPPRPLQEAAIHLADQLTSPCLVMVEASMGEGKTEAALYLADYLQHHAKTGGFYIGLPTQATSNAMFERVQTFLRHRYPQDVVNLTLSHAAALLGNAYQATICRLDQVYDREERGVFASEWHTVRKRTLLSPYGVGTIDQGLMGVVRSRHQFVRLFGLAGRTIILDEIHAYDLYTSTLLERFLEWAAVLGSPVIALSATLPQATRQRLLAAYATGCGQPLPALPEAPYPRITTYGAGTAIAQSFEASGHVRRTLTIAWVSDAWPQALQQQLQQGGCVAVICSTVNRAQEVYQQLQAQFAPEELGLFHGRFLFKDRERIEQDCLRWFGKETAHRPQRFVLVATQVIEQSLDVDFDLMISDLAPIDLLLQRSGRLHRHERDGRSPLLASPQLWIIEPTLTPAGKADFGTSSYIYDRHILLRSWLTLRSRRQVQLPEETDRLIEAVYNLDQPMPEDLEPVHRDDWQLSLDTYQTETTGPQQAKANAAKLPPPHGDVPPDQFTSCKWEDDEQAIAATTRLGRPSIATIFLQRTEAGLVFPDSHELVDLQVKPDLPVIQKLLAHSTRISNREVVAALQAQTKPRTWTSALLRNCRYVELDAQGVAGVAGWRLILDPLRGVLLERES
jgi:CRISPR-associated endonuclease/helicase Cas3